jgi:flagellar basal body-associated protein FliL
MKEWLILLLETMAVASALVALIIALMMMNAVARKVRPKKDVLQKERRTEHMDRQAKEGVTFNDLFMFMIAVPLVLLWVGFAGYVIWHGLRDPSVLAQIEGYTTLIAILGGPALLIIKDALDVWKQEQAEKTAFYKIKAQAVIDYNDAAQKQAQLMETNEQIQDHKERTQKKK